ncbi:sugar ABC transporter ATP-binding protein [Mahella sp.]|uniref:sugar ABC transporter ATP-binding protein n=1 Tax=Mahella sp. TaxID=2798721 RepID=UPI0025BAFE0E|nr:sugar ABC transporter ATP-binding protein [Mahella sp.]MBZ4665525.1 sugar transporter ATP-binding protein [Mahella sp.]
MREQVVLMEDINKSFPGVHALSGCHFDLNAGEVHALVGENGAGKSTLMKILAGIYKKDSGKILYKGKEVDFSAPKEAQDAGIGMIHQELNLIPHLTVAENIFIGKEFVKGIFIDQKAINRETQKLLETLNIDINPETKVRDLTVAKQQMVEIAKALSYNSDVIIMDEPTAALTESEIDELFQFIKDLKSKNCGVIYISHRIEEVFDISDRVTVMRDGQYVATLNTSETNKDEIIRLMVGRVIYEQPKEQSAVPEDAPIVLKVENLCSKDVKNVSFELRKGEILGFAGLLGSGRTETARLIFGADPKEGGEIFVKGVKVEINSPQDAVANGIGYLSEDRKRFGLALGLSVRENVTLASLDNYVDKGFIDSKKEMEVTNDYVKKLNIKTPSIEQLVMNLSGGNQQKAVMAKWLIKNSDILIFDEPTRGIDVGAKSEIYKLIIDLTKEGKSIIVISSELPEILRLSDRILVMCEGVNTGILDIAEADQEVIMKCATSIK